MDEQQQASRSNTALANEVERLQSELLKAQRSLAKTRSEKDDLGERLHTMETDLLTSNCQNATLRLDLFKAQASLRTIEKSSTEKKDPQQSADGQVKNLKRKYEEMTVMQEAHEERHGETDSLVAALSKRVDVLGRCRLDILLAVHTKLNKHAPDVPERALGDEYWYRHEDLDLIEAENRNDVDEVSTLLTALTSHIRSIIDAGRKQADMIQDLSAAGEGCKRKLTAQNREMVLLRQNLKDSVDRHEAKLKAFEKKFVNQREYISKQRDHIAKQREQISKQRESISEHISKLRAFIEKPSVTSLDSEQ